MQSLICKSSNCLKIKESSLFMNIIYQGFFVNIGHKVY